MRNGIMWKPVIRYPLIVLTYAVLGVAGAFAVWAGTLLFWGVLGGK